MGSAVAGSWPVLVPKDSTISARSADNWNAWAWLVVALEASHRAFACVP